MALTEADQVDLVPRIPSSPEQPFRCEFYACTMRGAVCVQRQTQVVKGRPRRGPRTGLPDQLRFRDQHCGTGKCEQGKAIAAALKGKVAAPSDVVWAAIGGPRRTAEVLAPTLPAPTTKSTAAPAAPPPTTEDQMAEKKTCNDPEGCKETAGRSGLCKKHYQRKYYRENVAKKVATTSPASSASRASAPSRRANVATAKALPLFPGTAELPDVKQLPSEYLVSCADELKRRAAELYRAARSMGFDPAADGV